MKFFDFFSQSVGIDLGTSNTLVYVKGKEIIVNEPSVVAITTRDKEVRAVGRSAKEMLEKTPLNVQAIRPLKDGVIADFDVTKVMIKYFIEKALNHKKFPKSKVVICIPVGVTSIEKRAVIDVAYNAGAKKVKLVEEPMAAAIGAGLPVEQAVGNMVIDIGGGTTEIAIISLGGIVVSDSVRVAGDSMDLEIKEYIKWKYKLDIGLTTSENVKKVLGNACADYYDSNINKKTTKKIDVSEKTENQDDEIIKTEEINDDKDYVKEMVIRGRDIVSGLPRSITVTTDEIREAIAEPVSNIVAAVKRVLEKTPPELSSDLFTNGIYLTGGGALLKGLDIYIEQETGLNVKIAENPLQCVALGAGKICETI